MIFTSSKSCNSISKRSLTSVAVISAANTGAPLRSTIAGSAT